VRKVAVSDEVQGTLHELDMFLTREYRMSRAAVNARIDRIYEFLASLSAPVDHARCRFERWHLRGYRCAVFEGWVFAYQVFENGVIIRDMAHGKTLDDSQA
jgi:hypothetical protein